MIPRSSVVALALLAVPLVRADVTNVVDVSALAAFGNSMEGETNGWFVSKFDNYADSVANFRLSEKDDYALSPDYGADIVRLILKVKSSSTTGRRLLFAPWNGTVYEASQALTCDYSPTKNTYVEQTLDVPEGLTLTRFAIRLETGGSTGWGVSRLWVVTRDPVFQPTGLVVVKKQALSCSLAWTNSACVVSNVIEVSRLDWSPASVETVFEADFDALFAGGNARDYTEQIPTLYPGLGGTLLYSPPNTNGILQISKGTACGVLVYEGLSDYSATFLRLNVRGYAGDHDSTSIYWTDGGTTNVLATLSLTEEFAWHEIDLESVPGEARLLINYDTIPSNRRIWLDAISIGRRGAFVETPLAPLQVAAEAGVCRFSTRNASLKLEPEVRYRFRVREMAADGRLSPAATVEARTEPRRGLSLVVR